MQHIADGTEHIYLAPGTTDFRKQYNYIKKSDEKDFISAAIPERDG